MHRVRPLLFGDEVASRVFGEAGVHLGQYFGVLALAVELLQLRAQTGSLGRGGGEGDAVEYRKPVIALSCPEPLFPGDLGLS